MRTPTKLKTSPWTSTSTSLRYRPAGARSCLCIEPLAKAISGSQPLASNSVLRGAMLAAALSGTASCGDAGDTIEVIAAAEACANGRLVDGACRCDLGFIGAPDASGEPTQSPQACVELTDADVSSPAPRRFLAAHGAFELDASDTSAADPRNPRMIRLQTPASSVQYATTVATFSTHDSADAVQADNCHYLYAGSQTDPFYFPQGYVGSVWDLFELMTGEPEACQAFAHLALRSPHGDAPDVHMHARFGPRDQSFDELLSMSEDPELEFDPWWNTYVGTPDSQTPEVQAFSFSNFNGVFEMDSLLPSTVDDPRNPSRVEASVQRDTGDAVPLDAQGTVATFTFYAHDDPDLVEARCEYRYGGARPDPSFGRQFRTSVWDVFVQTSALEGDCAPYSNVIVRSPHSDPQHVHLRYGSAPQSPEALMAMSLDPEAGFDPWWSTYCREGVSGCD